MTESARDRIRRLPSGPHGLPAELVERNQRERLIAAMAEVCEERGYAESSVAEMVRRAGVSTASFYRQFEDKQECMLASFEELFGRLLEEVDHACGGADQPVEQARKGIVVAAELLAADPPTARLLSIEIVAVGPAGVRAQHEAIDRMAALLRAPPGGAAASAPDADLDAAWAAAAAMVALVGRRIAEGRSPDAAELEALVVPR